MHNSKSKNGSQGTQKRQGSQRSRDQRKETDGKDDKPLDAATREQLRREKKCFKCGKPWKRGHKCDDEQEKEPQAATLQVERPAEAQEPALAELLVTDLDLRALLGYEAYDTATEFSAGDLIAGDLKDPALNALFAAPEDASELLYTPVPMNDVEGWAMVDSGATSTFLSADVARKHGFEVTNVSGTVVAFEMAAEKP